MSSKHKNTNPGIFLFLKVFGKSYNLTEHIWKLKLNCGTAGRYERWDEMFGLFLLMQTKRSLKPGKPRKKKRGPEKKKRKKERKKRKEGITL
jgi:hypothetical protein